MRCTSTAVANLGVYRCVFELGDGHTEHHYNYYRAFTKEEKEKLRQKELEFKHEYLNDFD